MRSQQMLLILVLFLINIFNNLLINGQNDDCFRAAVYQHLPFGNLTDISDDIVKRNLDIFEEIASKASKLGANILVFPEDATNSVVYPRERTAKNAEQIPDPQTGSYNPCEKPDEYKSRPKTYRLSCFAKTNKLYIVADYGDRVQCDPKTDLKCPEDGHYLFNTAVAFAPDGSIAAKYHKMQLYYEYYYNIPPKDDIIYFDTPFGRMGLFICFDILFKNPGTQLVSKYGVQTMLYPTWWFDELPIRSAKQIQEAWAMTNRVNLLAANMQRPKTGSIGSGIYSGQNGAIITTNSFGKTAQLLIADIPIDSRNTGAKCLTNRFNQSVSIDRLVVDSDYASNAKFNTNDSSLLQLKGKQNSVNVCNNGFCCKLEYSVESEDSLEVDSYWLLVANRTAKQHYSMCEEVCSVFRCDDDSCRKYSTKAKDTIFEKLSLSARFSTNYTYPSASANDLELVPKSQLIYKNPEEIGSEVSLSLDNFKEPIVAMSLYGRCYQRDPPYKQ